MGPGAIELASLYTEQPGTAPRHCEAHHAVAGVGVDAAIIAEGARTRLAIAVITPLGTLQVDDMRNSST